MMNQKNKDTAVLISIRPEWCEKKIIISGYESDLYNTALAGWHKDHTMSQTTSTEMAEETIWMNYEPPTHQLSIWEKNI